MLIILAVVFFIIMAFVGVFGIIWEIFKQLCSIIYWGIVGIYEHYTVEKPMEKSGFLQRKAMEEKLLAAEKANKHKEQIIQKENKIISQALSSIRELRIKYPYGDEILFQRYLKKFNVLSLSEMEQLENEIRKSHIMNEAKFSIETQEIYNYTLADLNGLEWLEEQREDPIIMRIYKVNNDYILHIKDIDKNEHQLLQSKDYLVVARVVTQVSEQQKKLKEMKKTIESEQIITIFKDITISTNLFRKNRMNFL